MWYFYDGHVCTFVIVCQIVKTDQAIFVVDAIFVSLLAWCKALQQLSLLWKLSFLCLFHPATWWEYYILVAFMFNLVVFSFLSANKKKQVFITGFSQFCKKNQLSTRILWCQYFVNFLNLCELIVVQLVTLCMYLIIYVCGVVGILNICRKL